MSKHLPEEFGIKPGAENFPLMVVLSFTYVCNARCPNCPYNNSDIRSTYKDALHMPDSLFKQIAEECGKHNAYIRISGGGEPMLHPNAVDLLVYAKSVGSKIGLITNGSNLSRSKLTTLINNNIDVLEFSADAGDAQTYKTVRPGLSWDALVRTVARARTIRDTNNKNTKIIVSIIDQKGIDVVGAQAFWSGKVDNVQIRKFLTWGYNQNNSGDDSPYLPPDQRIPCPWLFERLNIDSRGDVTICGEDIAFNHKFANIKDTSIQEVWLSKTMQDFRKKHLERRGEEISICSTCPDWKYRSWKHNYWKLIKEKHDG